MFCEKMEEEMSVAPSTVSYDGTRLFHLGRDVYIGVQLYNNQLSYVLRVSCI